jgi:signal transduction histidine kinase
MDPTSVATRDQRTCVCNDIAGSQIDPGWRQRAQHFGFASAIALPLIRDKLTIGVLTVYGAEADDFDDAAVELLKEMAENLRFSIDHFEHDRQRRDAERARTEYAQHLAKVSRRVVQVQEEERRRLAVELHDTAGTSMVAVQFSLAMVERSLRGSHPSSVEILRESIRMLADIVTDVRNVCAELRPSVLDYLGLSSALETCAKNFSRLGTMTVHYTQDPSMGRLPVELETPLYRIAQEALTNCAKHAAARTVELHLGIHEGRVNLTIADDGAGFDLASLASDSSTPGLGLLSMRERAEFMGGSLTVDSRPGIGTQIRVELPMLDEHRPQTAALSG